MKESTQEKCKKVHKRPSCSYPEVPTLYFAGFPLCLQKPVQMSHGSTDVNNSLLDFSFLPFHSGSQQNTEGHCLDI